MPISLKMRTLLLAMRFFGGKPLDKLSISEARKASDAQIPKSRVPAAIASISNCDIPGPESEIPIRIYTPEGEGPFALVVFFHGGGFVVGSLDGYDEFCRNLCHGAGCIIVSVDYRLAPENKFPAATDDCLAATRWVAEHAAEFNADPAHIVVVGDSAGGNLAAVTSLRIREEGGPFLCGQLLIYPVTDYHTPATPSYLTNANGYLLTRDMMVWFWNQYLDNASEACSPLASPLRALDLSGLPQAMVITAEYDPLRDEGEHYAERLQQAGVPTELLRYNGMIHGFLMLGALFNESRQAIIDTTMWLKKVTSRSG